MNIEIGNVNLDLRLEIDPESGDVCLIANETVALIYIDKETGKLFRAHIPEHAVITVNPLPIKDGYIEMGDELSGDELKPCKEPHTCDLVILENELLQNLYRAGQGVIAKTAMTD